MRDVTRRYQWGLPWRSSDQDSELSLPGPGSIPGQGTKTRQAARCSQKKKRRRRRYQWNKEGPSELSTDDAHGPRMPSLPSVCLVPLAGQMAAEVDRGKPPTHVHIHGDRQPQPWKH